MKLLRFPLVLASYALGWLGALLVRECDCVVCRGEWPPGVRRES